MVKSDVVSGVHEVQLLDKMPGAKVVRSHSVPLEKRPGSGVIGFDESLHLLVLSINYRFCLQLEEDRGSRDTLIQKKTVLQKLSWEGRKFEKIRR